MTGLACVMRAPARGGARAHAYCVDYTHSARAAGLPTHVNVNTCVASEIECD
eukprot:COSAG02_NODE_51_length_44689_cov_29.477361_28_plen_52_part_00